MSNPTSSQEPASRRLARLLRDAIANGKLKAGDRLPSERAMAEEHQVARNTAREAVRLLAEEGLVTAEHGRGVFVRSKPKLLRFGQTRYSASLRERTGLSPYRAEVEAQGRTPSVNCVSITQVPAPTYVAERLDLPDGAPVVRRENQYFADDEPTQIGVTYIPAAIAEETPLADSANLGIGSLYARFADQGHTIAATREEIAAAMPTPEEVALLQIPDGVPVLHVTHTGIDQNDMPFEVTVFTLRADLNGLDYTMPIEDDLP